MLSGRPICDCSFASLTRNYITCNTIYIEAIIIVRIKLTAILRIWDPRSKDEYDDAG